MNMRDDLTGPALGGATAHYEREWLHDFTRNSQAMIQSGDSLAVRQWKLWEPSVMTPFPNFTEDDLDDIFIFIESVYYHSGQEE